MPIESVGYIIVFDVICLIFALLGFVFYKGNIPMNIPFKEGQYDAIKASKIMAQSMFTFSIVCFLYPFILYAFNEYIDYTRVLEVGYSVALFLLIVIIFVRIKFCAKISD
ncbi:MAG: hypothetical protein ACRCST_05095 [Turicibacter sp.]